MAYDIGQVTDMFDTLSAKVINELDSQFNKGRIKGTDYANAYAALLSTIIQVCIDVPLKDKQTQGLDKDIELKDAQIQQIENDIEVKDKQVELQELQVNKDIEVKDKQIQQAENDIEVKNKQLELQELQTNKDIEIKDRQIALQELQAENDIAVKNKQLELQELQVNKDIAVKDRQIQGFDDKIRTDLFKTQMDTWGMMFASGMLDKKPDIITNDETSTLYNTIKSRLR